MAKTLNSEKSRILQQESDVTRLCLDDWWGTGRIWVSLRWEKQEAVRPEELLLPKPG